MKARVVSIAIAPVKAMALVHHDEIVVGAIGVVGNRRFWLRDANGNLFNAKKEGRLLQIRPEWDESSRRLALTFPDGRRVEGLVELGEPVDAIVYGELRPSRRVSARPGPTRCPNSLGGRSNFFGRTTTLSIA
jgi:uncharacterized protein YcbX